MTMIPSATVLLLRDSTQNQAIEVFMVARQKTVNSFSGALVFPGGKVDPLDQATELRNYCTIDGTINASNLALRIAAVREVFEESGLLLARSLDSTEIVNQQQLQELSHYRQALDNREISMLELCQQERLQLALDLLMPYAHWITPKTRPKIFDTHFYLARAPREQLQLATHDGNETIDSIWITAQNALQQAAQGQRNIVFPTRMNLLKLDQSKTVAVALQTAATESIATVQPVVENTTGGNILNIPKAAGYAASRVYISDDGRDFQFLDESTS